MFRCAIGTLPMSLRSAPMTYASVLSFLDAFLLALHVVISSGLSFNHHVAPSGGQNDIDFETDYGNFNVHSFVHNLVLLYALSHVHSSGMTCYVLQVPGQSLWDESDGFSIATHYSFQPQEGDIPSHHIFGNSALYIVVPKS